MRSEQLQRREFHRFSAAAFGGVLAGALGGRDASAAEEDPKILVDPSLLLKDPNVCRGLNTCQGKGKGEHSCAGQSACATAAAHSCNGMNECKGLGGCGGYPGQNTCKGHGHCAVPLCEKTWPIARKQFEHLMTDAKQKFGDAPKAK